MFIDHCQAQKIGQKWCAKPEITNCAPATSKLYMESAIYPAGGKKKNPQVQICNISGPTLLVYTWNLPYIRPEAKKKPPQVQICNISGRMQKKPPRCRYVMYPAGPTLLVYTWNLPYIWLEAKKTPQVQICNISGRTYIIGIHMESAIYSWPK
jgi:hypothetical protein